MARTKKEEAAQFAFADPSAPTLHELNTYAQLLAAGKATAAEPAAPAEPEQEQPTE